MSAPPATVRLRYDVPRTSPDWTLPEEPVPESVPHDLTILLLQQLLSAWVARRGASAHVARNLAVRWDEAHPKVGVDPDLCVIEPRTPEGDELTSLRTWLPGHTPPRLAIEVVSANHPYKDYASAPEKYAACGTQELWIFDAKLAGPRSGAGPHRLQIWRRHEDEFERIYAGEGPAWSDAVQGWLFVVREGERLRLADDREGTRWWPTAEEHERAEKEAALARAAELESRLAGKSTGAG